MISETERQLWDWLADCEARKPGSKVGGSEDPDKVVRVLQYAVREGSEARKAGNVRSEDFGELQ